MKTYSCPIEVRGYELDAYNHVNHAVYLNYLEHARWKLLEQNQITFETFKKLNAWPVVAAIEVKYLKPTLLGDSLLVKSSVLEFGKTSFKLSQKIYRGEQPVTEAIVTAVMINSAGRPTAIPAEILRSFEEHPAHASAKDSP